MKQNKFTGDRDDRRHTSMDSDENDYQGRGLPYALPKFDFDEGNLRFDSLVENEVFLGIPSQDDNQWIEDFSRGSSGIDFTSSAPDSCSIPRHNNVWSEATSSESVEMLLKSVGQEEMILEESLVRDSNTRNELPSSDQMDTDFMHNSKIGDLEESSCGTPPAQFLQDFSPLNKAKPENISSSHGFEPVDVCAGGVGGEKTTRSIIVTEENLPVDVKGDDENAGKDCNLFGESSIDKFHDDNIALSCLSSDPITGSGIPSGQNKVPDISSENLGLPVDTNIVGGHGASDISFVLDDGQVTRSPTEMHTSVVHSAVCVASETEVWSENAVKTTSNIEQSPMLPPQGNSGLPAEEGCKSEVFSTELTKASSDGCVVLTEGTGNEPESESKILCGEKPCAVIKGDDGCSREQSSVVSEIGNECGNEQSFAVCNNDQCIVYPELEKESVVPKVMSGRVMDGDDAVGVHGASGSSFMLDDGQAMESPTPSVLHSAAYVTPEKESVVENADKTTTNTEQSPMLPPQDNSTLHIEEGCKSGLFSPDLTMVSIDDYAASSEGTDNQLQSESKDLCSEKSCAVIEVDDGCSTVQSSMVSEIGNACGSEQSFAASNNDQCVVYPELEKQSAVPKVTSDGDDVFISSNSSKDVDHVEPAEAEPTEAEHAEAVVPKVMSGRVMDGDDAVGVHGASGSSFMLDDGQAMESPTPSVLHSAAYVTPEKESVVENADKTTTNIEQSPMLPLQDNSTLHTEEGCKSGLFSPDLTMVSIDDYAAPSEGTDNQLQSESKDLCSEKSCAVIEVDDGCNTVQSSVVSEIGNACGNEQSFAAGNNDQCVVYPEPEKQSAVPKVTSDGDDDVFISSNSSKEVDHVEPVEAEPTEAEHAEAVQEPNDVKLFNVPQERNDGNLTSDLVNKNSETHEVIIISAESTQSVNDVHVQPTEADSSPKPSTGMSAEQDSHDGNPINVTRERNGETLASESGNANSERDEPSFNSVDITKSMDHLESTESSPSLKLITGMSAEPDSHDRKPVNVMQKSTDESMSSDAINTNFKIVLPVDDGNNAGARSSNNATEENVESTGGADFGPHTAGETGSLHEVGNFPSVPLGADTVVKSIHQNEDQISQTMPSEASISDNNEDKKDTANVDASMVDIDEKMKQGPDVIVVKSAPSAETKAKDVNQSMDLVELHGGQTNVEQVMTEVVQKPCGAESVSQPAFSSPVMHDQKALSGGPKGTSERKTRRGSGKLAKGNPAKGNCSKEVESKIQRDVGNTLCVVLSPSSTVKPMPLEAGSSALKPTAVVAQSSNLPDLNTSTSTAVLFRQPFTDLQQVQLRAQIFVYGSLIQGAAPDEACMVSAFGTSDGGRSIWEPAWRACIQRLQKSHLSNPETPVQSRSGAKALDQVTKTGLSQRKSRVSSNGNSSSVVTAIIPLSSPLWNISTPSSDSLPTNTVARSPVIDYQTLPPLHGYQTPANRNYAGHTRVSQAPFPVPWMASPQASPYNVNAHIAPPQPTEIVKLTTVKASPAPSPSTMNASSISVGQEKKKGAASYAPHSVEPKSRKRKKVSVSENLAEISYPVAPGRTESFSVSVTPAPSVNRTPALGDLGPRSLPHGVQVENAGSFAANSQFLASATTPIPPGPGLKSSTEKAIAVVSPVSSVDHSARSHQIPEKRALSLDEVSKVDAKLQAEQASAHAAVLSRVIDHPASSRQFTESRALSLDEVAKVEEAKLHAEQASAHAAAAVSHCQNVWLQLGKQNSSNLMSDSEAKLASAAACIAAAASVAKAASAAAKVASTVALQAKLMADEALIPNRCLDSIRNTSGFANETGSATPASILKAGEGGNGSSSIIYAAREAARKRVEAASAASKHAENLDAIVKAAELAAEAVAQAGKIVALGDPFPLSKLVEGGPAGYWKDTGTPFSMGTKSNIVTQNNQLTSVEEHPDPTVEQSERPLDSISQAPVNSVSPDAIEKSKDLVDVQVKGKMATSEGLKSPAASKTTKTVGVVPESESGLRFSTDENMAGMIKDSRISVSSLVEVFKGNGDLTGAWFSATVSSLKSGKALVSYKDLETDQGRLMEWVPLEAGTRKPPVIRLAHPMTSLMFDGNRKRRREVVKDYNWSVGDRVDAWLENCWSEGVVVEKNKKDDTTLSVHFPAQGKTIPVKAWHLRPSLIWTDGEWIESLSSENDKSSQGDTPKEKRMKLGSPTVDDDGGKGKEKITKIMDPPESRKFEESRLLPLSAKEKSFHIGSTKNDKPETLRTMRSGLQREGPKVVFGVPKPGGKKRKFMDVSKHCVSSRNTNVNANTDKEKSARHLVPEGGAYGWKYSSKVVDVKEKQAAEPRTRNFKPTKPPSSFTRTLPQKGDKSLIPSVSGSKEGFSTDNNRTDATSNDDSSDHHTDFVSSSNVEGEEPISSSSRAPLPRTHRKMPPSNAKSERLMKGKPAFVHGKPNKVEVEKEKSVTDSSEPRRSNRKIQPTSRLLEGLQSSLIMSKTPLVSHEKSHKGQKFGAPRGMRS